MSRNPDAEIRSLRSDVEDMEARIQRLGRRSEKLEDALAEAATQNQELFRCLTDLVTQLERQGAAADLDIDLEGVRIGPSGLPNDHMVDINFEDPQRSSWDGSPRDDENTKYR